MKAKIQVGIRLRPFLDSEVSKGYMNSKVKTDGANNKISIQTSQGHGGQRVFEFDHILDPSATQDSVYEDCKISELVTRVLDGFHSTIFAYGQTGSGKTYTMEGKHEGGSYSAPEQKGIVARVFDDLFGQIAQLKSSNNKVYNVTCSFLQIYNEKIYDLLGQFPAVNSSNSIVVPPSLKLRWNAREQFQVENLFVFDVKTPRDATQYFLQGIKNRVTASHKLNMTSSRSHTIFTITVHAYTADGAHETSSKMQLVDLAGSERIALTGTEGKMAKESIDINKSLFTLRQVITALSEINQSNNNNNNFNSTSTAQHHGFSQNGHYQQSNNLNNSHSPDSRPASKHQHILSTTLTTNSEHKQFSNSLSQQQSSQQQQHIPYRESKLTSLLKQSIGGNCYCLMMACIVPNDSFVDENLSTIHYATRATYIRNKPIKNEDPNKQKIADLFNENSQLKEELDKANAHIAFLTLELQKSEGKLKSKSCRCFATDESTTTTPGAGPGGSRSKSTQHIPVISNPFSKEQQLLVQQQEQFKTQRNQQELHQRSQEDRILRMSRQVKEMEMRTTETNFVSPHNNFETSRLANAAAGPSTYLSKNSGDIPSTRSSSMQPLKQLQSSLQQSKELQLATAAAAGSQQMLSGGTPAEYENFSQRLIESITLVRSLLESNKELRQQTDESKSRMQEQETELAQLIAENQSLQDRIEELQSQLAFCAGNNHHHHPSESQQYSQPLSRNSSKDEIHNRISVRAVAAGGKLAPISSSNIEIRGQTKNDLIQEILELKQNYQRLESRMRSIDPSEKSPSNSNNGVVMLMNSTNGNSSQAAGTSFKKAAMMATQSTNSNTSARSNAFQLQAMSTSKNRIPSLQYPPSRGSSISNEVHPNIPPSMQNSIIIDPTPSINHNQEVNEQNKNSNRQSTDSVPTIFGRYTFYQSNFQNVDKLSSNNQVSNLFITLFLLEICMYVCKNSVIYQ